MNTIERTIKDVVIANRILALNKVLDAYGHVSIRLPENPERYFLARSVSPAIVEPEDVVEFHLDGTPVVLVDESVPCNPALFLQAIESATDARRGKSQVRRDVEWAGDAAESLQRCHHVEPAERNVPFGAQLVVDGPFQMADE